MIISFSGAQSTGKSTLLDKCKEEFGDKFVYFPEITRQIKSECGVAINEAGDNTTQILIVSEHIKNMLKASKQDSILDRCILDGLVYTMYLHFDQNKVDELVMALAIKVFIDQIDKVDVIFYPDPDDVQLVDDGERSDAWESFGSFEVYSRQHLKFRPKLRLRRALPTFRTV